MTGSTQKEPLVFAMGPLSPLFSNKDSFIIHDIPTGSKVTALALELPEWGILSVRGEDRLKVNSL